MDRVWHSNEKDIVMKK